MGFKSQHKNYLASTSIINWQHPLVVSLAKKLSPNDGNQQDIAKRCFEFVRDEIRHSCDFKVDKITLIASDVLAELTGYCFAKSHLLAALLRANHIPAGFCYQRLSINDDGAPFSLHGFNAIYLDEFGWYKIDARGNKEGVDAQFSPPKEQLAFSINLPEECTFSEIWPEPHPLIIDVLSKHKNNGYLDVLHDLPDIEWKL